LIEDELFQFYQNEKNVGRNNSLLLSIEFSQQTNDFLLPLFVRISHENIVFNREKLEKFSYFVAEQIKYQVYSTQENEKSLFNSGSLGSSLLSIYTIEKAIKCVAKDLNSLNNELKREEFKYKVKIDPKSESID
jgi:hypothetical protein